MFKFFDIDQNASETARQHTAEKLRERALLHPGLSLVEDTPAPDQPVARNDKGARLGYNPYESGQLTNKPRTAKRPDMRELSKWIEMKRRMTASGSEK